MSDEQPSKTNVDRLIELIEKVNGLDAAVRAYRAELALQNVKGGLYRGSDGRVVHVIEHPDHPRDFRLLNIKDDLQYS